jgi:ABC-type glycerol-3-phosphate transport system substrate-binding protein
VYSEDLTENYMTEEAAVDALTFWVQMYENGYVAKEFAVASPEAQQGLPNYWAEGKQLCNLDRNADCDMMAKQQPDFEYVIGHPTHRREGDPLTGGNAYGALWGITAGGKQKKAALVYVSFLIRPDNIGLTCTLTGMLPAGKAASRYWGAPDCVIEWLKRFAEYGFANQDSTTLWQESKTICGPHFAAAVLGEETVEEALQACKDELQVELDKMNA